MLWRIGKNYMWENYIDEDPIWILSHYWTVGQLVTSCRIRPHPCETTATLSSSQFPWIGLNMESLVRPWITFIRQRRKVQLATFYCRMPCWHRLQSSIIIACLELDAARTNTRYDLDFDCFVNLSLLCIFFFGMLPSTALQDRNIGSMLQPSRSSVG